MAPPPLKLNTRISDWSIKFASWKVIFASGGDFAIASKNPSKRGNLKVKNETAKAAPFPNFQNHIQIGLTHRSEITEFGHFISSSSSRAGHPLLLIQICKIGETETRLWYNSHQDRGCFHHRRRRHNTISPKAMWSGRNQIQPHTRFNWPNQPTKAIPSTDRVHLNTFVT